MYKYTYVYYASSPRREKLFIWPPFFQYNKRLLSQKTGGACVYMPQDAGHWLANFEVIPNPYPPSPQKLVFPRPKKEHFKGCARRFRKKSQIYFSLFYLLAAFCRKYCHADLDSCKQQAILLKKIENFRPKLRLCFSGENFGTILSRRSRLSRTSRAASRLS